MSPETSARLMRSSIDHATAPARYRSRRMARRDRQALARVALLGAIAVGYVAIRVALS